LIAVAAGRLSARSRSASHEVRWEKTVIDRTFRSEGVSVADVNRDGKPDILAGDLWYEAPDWRPREIRPLQKFVPASGYSDCFESFALDVDRDGWTDEIVIGMPGEKGVWYRNPGETGGEWKLYPMADSVCNESPAFADLDGDKKPELIFSRDDKQMTWRTPGPSPQTGFASFVISEVNAPGCARFSHGLGIGDVNGDGRADVLCKDGYWEAPKDRKTGPWNFVPADLGPDCAHMYVFDFNGDGRPDVISSSSHNFGVWWHERAKGNAKPEFKRHLIDDSFSQSHSLAMADLNGDGRPDFVTGKRRWAHGPTGDVDPNGPALLCWYEFNRKSGEVTWTRHVIDEDSGVGTQFVVTDVNGDKRKDIVTSNKEGVFLFEQAR
jgi:hypothetical protein